jgi:hypothetical protein
MGREGEGRLFFRPPRRRPVLVLDQARCALKWAHLPNPIRQGPWWKRRALHDGDAAARISRTRTACPT